MSRRSIPLFMLLGVALLAARPMDVNAQLDDTSAFLADVSNQYRVVSNVVYHVANNHENTLDLYLPANPSGATPVLMMIHGGGWVQGTKESQALRALPYLEMGWAVVNVTSAPPSSAFPGLTMSLAFAKQSGDPSLGPMNPKPLSPLRHCYRTYSIIALRLLLNLSRF